MNSSDKKVVEGLKKLIEGVTEDNPDLRDKLLDVISEGEKSFEWLTSAKDRIGPYLLEVDGEKPFVAKRAQLVSSFVTMLTSDSFFPRVDPKAMAAIELAFVYGMLAERDGWCIENKD